MDPARRAVLISSCRAKIARADEHIEELNREIDAWSDLEPCTLVRECDREGRQHIVRLRLNPAPNVWRWAQITGDALHDLRCALDHIVYALAIAYTGQDPPDDDSLLMFPVCSTPDNFRASRIQNRIKSLSGPAQAAIERAQPYNRTHPSGFSALWYLDQLNNVDKHRALHISAIAAGVDDIAIDAEPGTFKALLANGPYIDSAVVLRIILSDPNPNMGYNSRWGTCVEKPWLSVDTSRASSELSGLSSAGDFTGS